MPAPGARELGAGRLRPFLVPAAQDDAVALLQQRLGRLKANARVAAGDQGQLAVAGPAVSSCSTGHVQAAAARRHSRRPARRGFWDISALHIVARPCPRLPGRRCCACSWAGSANRTDRASWGPHSGCQHDGCVATDTASVLIGPLSRMRRLKTSRPPARRRRQPGLGGVCSRLAALKTGLIVHPYAVAAAWGLVLNGRSVEHCQVRSCSHSRPASGTRQSSRCRVEHLPPRQGCLRTSAPPPTAAGATATSHCPPGAQNAVAVRLPQGL